MKETTANVSRNNVRLNGPAHLSSINATKEVNPVNTQESVIRQ